MSKSYTPSEIEFIRENYLTSSLDELAEVMGRSKFSICKKAGEMGLSQRGFDRKTRPAGENIVVPIKVSEMTSESGKAAPAVAEVKDPIKHLSEFTPRELMEELRRRGYDGEITYTEVIRKVHNIKLSAL